MKTCRILVNTPSSHGGIGDLYNFNLAPSLTLGCGSWGGNSVSENVGVKHAKWDREDGYFVPRDCYNSYFYIVEDDSLNVIDKFKLHGAPYIQHLTGGSALHMNLDEHLSKAQYRQLLKVAAKEGCNYFTFNVPNTICNDCGNIDKRYLKECPHCHSKNIDYMTRIIGYLKRVSNFSAPRQEEAQRRYYATQDKV